MNFMHSSVKAPCWIQGQYPAKNPKRLTILAIGKTHHPKIPIDFSIPSRWDKQKGTDDALYDRIRSFSYYGARHLRPLIAFIDDHMAQKNQSIENTNETRAVLNHRPNFAFPVTRTKHTILS